MKQQKNPVGRPSELGASLEKAREYLAGGYEKVGEVIPNVAGLACYLGKARSRVYEYGEQSVEFKDILEGILSLQESKLVNGGLKGDFNPTIAKLILTKHGYSDKTELDHKNSDGSLNQPTTIKLVSGTNDNSNDSTAAETDSGI